MTFLTCRFSAQGGLARLLSAFNPRIKIPTKDEDLDSMRIHAKQAHEDHDKVACAGMYVVLWV
jgi:hypothetical protein